MREYDPRPQEDAARRNLAYGLVALLGVVAVLSLVPLLCYPDKVERVEAILQIVLTPLVALVASATGFYFGAKGKNP